MREYDKKMSQLIGVMDYGCGNIRSVINAIKAVGGQPMICCTQEDLMRVNKLILPGVGSFDRAMVSLKERNILESLKQYVEKKENKLLGICLGMQILCHFSEEGGEKGLGVIDAAVYNISKYTRLKVPHMGWNSVSLICDDPLLDGVKNLSDFYFVHSYCVRAKDVSVNIGISYYGVEFSSIIKKNNVWGVQFHPEKSQSVGLKIMNNFVNL